MCLAVPLKLVKINGKMGVGEYDGISREIALDFIKNPKIGEYLMVHAGFAVERMSEEDAKQNIKEWKEYKDACG